MVKRLITVSMMLACTLAGSAYAVASNEASASTISQQQATATGMVVDQTGAGVIGAGVMVKNTTNGTVTDVDGSFAIKNVPVGAVIEVSCIGYKTVEVVFNGQPINVTLVEDTEMLNEVVVTALGISREKKSLGYAVQDVKADELTRGGGASLTDALQGKVAGLAISNSGTGAGGSTRVVIRGSSSLSDNNEPLYVVDGVPYDTGGHDIDGQAGLWGGTDRAGGAFDINPEDIESVSVLKGPTAAALYGSRAGNGVILITTKKGGKNGKIGVTYNGKFSWSPIAYYLDLQDKYGQGSDGQFVDGSDYSWGAPMNGQSIPAWWDAKQTTKYVSAGNPYKAYYQVGSTQSNNVTIAGGSKEAPFRLTIGHDDTQANVKPTTIKKTSVDFVSSLKLTDWLSFDVKANYVNTIGHNRQTRGLYGASYYINVLPRSISMDKLSEYRFDPDELLSGNHVHMNYRKPDASHQNPYFAESQMMNKDTQHKFFGMGTMNIKFNDNLKFSLKEGYNWVDYQVKNWHPYNDPVFPAYPEVNMSKGTTIESDTEALLSYNNKWGDFEFGASAGASLMSRKYEGLYGRGQKIPLANALFVAAGSILESSNSLSEKETQSVYAFANLGYKGWLYVDVTARNDWSSTLPKGNNSYFYPSVSLSALLTGAADAYGMNYNKDIVDYAKVRVSAAKVGKDTSPYQLLSTYGTTTGENGLLTITQPTTKANSLLKPEMATSWEVGTEWHFFKNRLGLDFTYYSTTTKNQVMSISFPYSSGVQSKFVNAGEIQNSGIELQLHGEVLRTKNWEVGANLNLAKNNSEVKTLYHDGVIDVDRYEIGHMTGSAGVYVYAIENRPLGDIYGKAYKRDAQGNVVLNDDGLPIGESNSYLGNINPDFTGSLSLYASFKNVSLSALFQFQQGGDLFSVTEYGAAVTGTAKRTENRDNFTFEGKKMNAQKFWINAIDEEFMYDASYIKLGELSLSYNFKSEWLEKNTKGVVNSAKVAFFGSNLFYLHKNTPGTTPDGSHTDTSVYAQAFDMCPSPSTRTFGVSLNIGF